MDQQILQTILKDTYNLATLKKKLRILKAYLLNAIFGPGEKNGDSPDSKDMGWISTLPSGLVQQFNKDNVYPFFESVEKQVAQYKPLIIYLPFDPDDNVLLQIGSYCRKTFNNPFMLIDTKYSSVLIAGCALSWKGIYKDYSLHARISERKLAILEGLRRFLR